MSQPVRTRPMHAALAIVLSSAVTLLVAEIALRAFSDDRYYVWPRETVGTVASLPDVTPGIWGERTFSTNEFGIRGRGFEADDEYRILAVGGSTTENILVDDEEAWPHLLEIEMNRAFPDTRVWVGNVGRSGMSARDHTLHVEKLPPQYPRIDAALVLVGVNDLALRLNRHDEYVPFSEAPPEYHDGLLTHAFASIPLSDRDYPFYKKTKLGQMLRGVAGRLTDPPAGPDQSAGAGYLVGVRERRQRAARRDSLPDLTSALGDYARTLDRIVTSLEDQGIKPILMTQPYMWRGDLSDKLESLLWFGRVGRSSTVPEEVFYTARALAEGMRLHNEVLLDLCRRRQLACVDLDAALPRDTTVFYDDVHFNEAGNRRVATTVAEALSRDPDIFARLAR